MVLSPFLRWSRSSRGDRLSQAAVVAVGMMGLWALEMGISPTSAMAQSVAGLPSCEAPGPNEYLLLVALQTEEAQGKLAETLPPSVKAPTCNYLGSRVARMGGFQTPADADAWASYLRDVAALPAFVAKPTQASSVTSAAGRSPSIQDPANVATAARALPKEPKPAPAKVDQAIAPPLDVLPPPVIPAQPRLGAKIDVPDVGASSAVPPAPTPLALPKPVMPSASSSVPALAVPSPPTPVAQVTAPQAPKTPAAGALVTTYEPKVLADGYVVLVDYGNQTSLAPLLRQLTKRPVGLASYGQRPFLMVNYTPDSKAALATLKSLDRSGFRTMLVEGARVTLLTPDVQVK